MLRVRLMTTTPSTPSNVVDLERTNKAYVWTVSLVAAMGGLLFGYDWVVIGGAKPFFEKYFELNSEELSGWANSCALVGCLIGSLVTGGLSDKLGRKKLLLASAFLFAVSSVMTGWAHNFQAFVCWRIVGGIGIGMASALSPMYIAEIAPASMRGRLVSLNQLMIVIGILAAQIVNFLIARPVPDDATAAMIGQSWNGQVGWRWMFTAVAVPSVFFFIGGLLVPESPRWLIKNGLPERAQKVLTRLGGAAYAENEIRDVQATLAAGEIHHVRFQDLLEPQLAKPLLIGCGLAVLQQWCGINVMFSYAEEIYRQAGYGVNDILFNIVCTGSVFFLFTLLALATVDKLGRRLLMLFGCGGLFLSHLFIGIAYSLHWKGLFVLVFTLAAIGCYAMSLAPVTWVLISEIFPNRIRGAAMSVSVTALWIACFLLTYAFPMLNHWLGSANTFWLFSAVCALGLIFIALCVPETKGRTLEQIENGFQLSRE
jgi:sugar porter (SP) family MFS transporter